MGDNPRIAMLSALRSTVVMRRCAPVALDWGKLATKVTTDSGKAELAALRSEVAEVNKSLEAGSAGGEVDWAFWKSKIATPGAVDQFKAAYDGLEVPTLEDTFTAELTSKFDAAIKAAEEHAEASEVRIKELEEQLEALAQSKLEVVNRTVDEELAANPALAQEIEAEIAENNWK